MCCRWRVKHRRCIFKGSGTVSRVTWSGNKGTPVLVKNANKGVARKALCIPRSIATTIRPEYRVSVQPGCLCRPACLPTSDSLYFLGLLKLYGISVSPDAGKALEYIRKAAELRHPEAMAALGVMLLHGRGEYYEGTHTRQSRMVCFSSGDSRLVVVLVERETPTLAKHDARCKKMRLLN